MILQLNGSLNKLFFLVLVLLCFISLAIGQTLNLPSETVSLGQGNNIIIGSVVNSEGQRLSTRVKVRLSTMTKGDVNTLTDENGNFIFRGLASGSYTIIIDKEKEYEPFSQQVDIVQLRGASGGTYNVTIRLISKGEFGAKPGVINSEFAGVPKKALDYYDKAIELAKKGNRQEAIKELQTAISIYRQFMMAFNEMGVQYLRLNELEKADEAFQSAIKIKPDSFTPLTNRGIVLVHLKKFEEAEKILREAIKLKEKSAVGHYFLGRALANLGKFDEAEQELVLAVELGGEQMREAHRLLAIIYSTKGRKKEAAAELKTYLRLFPNTADAEQLRKVIAQLEASEEAVNTKAKPSN